MSCVVLSIPPPHPLLFQKASGGEKAGEARRGSAGQGPRVRGPGLESQLLHLLAVEPRACPLPPLCLCFLAWEMGMMLMSVPSEECHGDQTMTCRQSPSSGTGHVAGTAAVFTGSP